MRQLAHLADIERQLLAPLQTLLGDAQAVLGTELDSVRLDEAASAISFDLPAATPSAARATEPEDQRVARTPVAEVSLQVPQGSVALPQALALRAEQAASMGGASAPGIAVPSDFAGNTSVPIRLAGDRFDESLSTASPSPPESGSPLPTKATARNHSDATTPFARPHPISASLPSTTSVPLQLPAARSEKEPAIAPTAAGQPIPLSRTAGAAPLIRSPAADGQPLQAALPLSGAEPVSYRLPGIPLRPRQVQVDTRSSATPGVTGTPAPGKGEQTAARRLAAAVEPSLEHAYRLSQAKLDTARLATTEAESSSLVRNTFNVTVALAASNADLDPTKLEDALTDVLRAAARRHGLEL